MKSKRIMSLSSSSETKSVEVLIPCVNKTQDDILALCDFLKIDSCARFCNQKGEDSLWEMEFKGHRIVVINVSWKGVSKARNTLLDFCAADIGLFIDDDCVLADGYESQIIEAYGKNPNALAVRFNTTREHWNPVHAEAKKAKRGRFRNLSSFGVWGLSLRIEKWKEVNIRFDETLGAPNYLYNGEDSLFLFQLCKASRHIYLNPFFVCDVRESRESTWFETFDERYFTTKGYIYRALYGLLWEMALLRMYIKYRKDFSLPWKQILQWAKKGSEMFVQRKEHRFFSKSSLAFPLLCELGFASQIVLGLHIGVIGKEMIPMVLCCFFAVLFSAGLCWSFERVRISKTVILPFTIIGALTSFAGFAILYWNAVPIGPSIALGFLGGILSLSLPLAFWALKHLSK